MNKAVGDLGMGTYAVTLPCEPAQFGKFISGLLGKPQTIVGRESGVFEIDRAEIRSLYHLVCQRVAEQNNSSLVQFTVRLVFSDGSSVLLNSLGEFDNYNQIRAVSTTQVHMSWSFLIQFQDRAAPEKQDIDISFLSEMGPSSIDDDDSAAFFLPPFRRIGLGAFRVQHTARTWGADIEALLSSHLKNIVVSEPPLRRFARKNSSKISLFGIIGIFLSILWGIYFVGATVLDERREIALKLLGSANSENQKLDGLITFVSSGQWERVILFSFWYALAGFILSVALGMWMEHTADNVKPSFIMLTKQDETRKSAELRKYDLKWFSFLMSIVVGVSTGVMGNVVYSQIWG